MGYRASEEMVPTECIKVNIMSQSGPLLGSAPGAKPRQIKLIETSIARTGLSLTQLSSNRSGNKVPWLRSSPTTKRAIESPYQIAEESYQPKRFHTAWVMNEKHST
jgi:hypothetical protein